MIDRTVDRAAEDLFPRGLEHHHGLSEWWPMLPERSAETIEPGRGLAERLYRCQAVGCGHVVRVGAAMLGAAPEAERP